MDFVGATGKKVPTRAVRIFDLNFFAGFGVAAATYLALRKAMLPPATSKAWMEVGGLIADQSMAHGQDIRDDLRNPGSAEEEKHKRQDNLVVLRHERVF